MILCLVHLLELKKYSYLKNFNVAVDGLPIMHILISPWSDKTGGLTLDSTMMYLIGFKNTNLPGIQSCAQNNRVDDDLADNTDNLFCFSRCRLA